MFAVGANTSLSTSFDSISNHLVMLDDVQCSGNEDKLLDCSHSIIGSHLCGQFLQDEPSKIVVQCQGS